ncbi:MAG: PAS domain S-box protein [Pseudomonadota bacterium]
MESFSAAVVATIAEAVLVVDAKGEIVRANAHATEFFGYSDDELRGRKVEMLIPERFRTRHADLRAGFVGETQPRMMGANRELFGLRKDGREFPVEVGLGPMRLGEDHYVVVSLADISKRRQIEFQARWCEAIVKSSEDAIISLTLEGIVTTWNPKAQAMFGYRAEEIINHSILVLVPDDRKQEVHAILEKIHKGEDVSNFETVRLHKDGTPIDVSVTISPVCNEAGNLVGFSGAERDITERKRAELEIARLSAERASMLAARTTELQLTEEVLADRTSELRRIMNRQAEDQRRKVEEERRRLSQDLHDEIGQMLTALNFNLEMVRRKSTDSEATLPLNNAMQITQDIVKGVRRIVQQLRPPQLEELGLAAALRWHLDSIRNSSYLTIVLTENLGVARVSPEIELGCFRIVQEALTNIVRHASATHVEVRLTQEPKRLHLMVIDDGVGLQLSESASEVARNGHLGLQGMRERARGLGGRLQIISVPERGCTIEVEIPLDGTQ